MTCPTFMVVAFMLAIVVVQSNQCSSGCECPSDDKPDNLVSLLQTKLQTNVLEDGPLIMKDASATLAELEGMAHSGETLARQDLSWQKLHMAVQNVALALGVTTSGGTQSFAPRAPHVGRCEGILVPYEARWSPGKGLGIFLTKPVKKGEAIWRFRQEDFIEIYEHDMPALRSLLKAVHNPEVVNRFLTWTWASDAHRGVKNETVVLFEASDERFVNSAPGKQATALGSDPNYSFAARDIEAGEEWTEDYTQDNFLPFPDWFDDLYDEFDFIQMSATPGHVNSVGSKRSIARNRFRRY